MRALELLPKRTSTLLTTEQHAVSTKTGDAFAEYLVQPFSLEKLNLILQKHGMIAPSPSEAGKYIATPSAFPRRWAAVFLALKESNLLHRVGLRTAAKLFENEYEADVSKSTIGTCDPQVRQSVNLSEDDVWYYVLLDEFNSVKHNDG